MTATTLLGLALLAPGAAGAELAVPPLSGHVIDQTATFSPAQQASLEQTLQALEARKGSQLVVLMVVSTAPQSIEQYALRVAEQWKLGRKGVDDGAVLVIAKQDRALRLEVGYELEGVLNDATSKRIVADTITPYFVQADFYGGVVAGVTQITHVIDGEPLPAVEPDNDSGLAGVRQYGPILLVLTLVGGGMLSLALGRVAGAVATGGAVALIAWLFAGAVGLALLAGIVALLFTLLAGGLGGRGFLGGLLLGSAGAGPRRGGFGGGGGSFGGGGASGRW